MHIKQLGLSITLLLFSVVNANAETDNNQCGHLFGAFTQQLDAKIDADLIPGNEIVRIPDAVEDYQMRQTLRAAANDHIHLYTLFFENNRTGLDSAAQLVEKAAVDGVEVNVLFSLLGQITTSITITTALRNMGVNAVPYIPQNLDDTLDGIITSSHKKLLITDSAEYGLQAIVGGRNIGDNYFINIDDSQPGEFENLWKDLDILLRGPAVHSLVDDFIHTFNRMVPEDQALTCEDQTNCRYYPTLSTKPEVALASMRVVQNEPDEGIVDINTLYNELITAAQSTIDIQTPYFIPQGDLLESIYQALDAGVRVRILTNSRESNDLGVPLFYASAFYWADLIAAGAEIYLWELPRSGAEFRTMHAKVMTVDACVYAPGSWNFDGRSYYGENEYAFPINSQMLSDEATTAFENDLQRDGVTPVDAQWFAENFSSIDYLQALFFATIGTRYL